MERSDKSGSGEDWWQAADGRWYPRGMAHHPAARAGAAGPGTQPAPVDVDAAHRAHHWRAWAVLLLPLLVILVLVLAAVDAASDPATVDAAGDSDPPDIGDPPDTTVTTAAPTTTAPDLTMAPDPSATPQRPPPVPPVTATAPSTIATAPPPVATDIRLPSSTVGSSPTTPDDCRHGRWRHLVDRNGDPFRNRHACVSSLSPTG
jgi:hypothetical protein